MKTILVDAWNTFVTNEGIFNEMKDMLEKFDNKKIILTNANEGEKTKYGIVNIPFEVFTLSHNPNKSNSEYYKKMLEHFNLSAEEVIYFEHNEDAVKSAKSVGIKTFHYDKDKRDLVALKKFLDENLLEKKKTQIFYIHGGMTFKSQEDYLDFLEDREISIDEKISWNNNYLKEELRNSCKIIKPRMPLQDNAKYDEWKISFERYFDLLDDEIILIGSSLGGVFLSKYLSENVFPKKIISLYLVCPPFDDSLVGEDLVGGFELKEDLSLIEKNCKDVTLLFSGDDDCVPTSHAKKYKDKLPNSKIIIYESKNGHFLIKEFPEIVEMIKEDLKRNGKD